MNDKVNSIAINVRISPLDAENINTLVKTKQFISISDAVRHAIRILIAKLKAEARS